MRCRLLALLVVIVSVSFFIPASATSGLDITVSCPFILFLGEKASWVVTVSYYGQLYSPPTLEANLIKAENGESVLSFTKSDFTSTSIAGIFVVSYGITSSFVSGFYSLVVRAYDDTKNFGPNSWVRGVGQAGFQISNKIASDATIQSIKDGIAEVKTSVRDVKLVIDEIQPKIVEIKDDIVTLQTRIGELKTTIDAIHVRLIAYNSTFALIHSDVRQSWLTLDKIQTNMLSLPGNVASKVVFPVTRDDWSNMQMMVTYLMYAVVGLGAFAIVVAFMFRRQQSVISAQQMSGQMFPQPAYPFPQMMPGQIPGVPQPQRPELSLDFTSLPPPIAEKPSQEVIKAEEKVMQLATPTPQGERKVELPQPSFASMPPPEASVVPSTQSVSEKVAPEKKNERPRRKISLKDLDLGETVIWS